MKVIIGTNPKAVVIWGRKVFVASAAILLLTACAEIGGEVDYTYTEDLPGAKNRPDHSGKQQTSIFGPDGIVLFGGKRSTSQAGVAIPVNSLLWRASLDTLSFLPLLSADPFGGVIISDWYTFPESSNERFKITVYILSQELRADGLKVSIFRQLRHASGDWVDATVKAGTMTQLENTILTRAREMHIALNAE